MSDSDKIGNNQSGQHSQAHEDRLEFSEEEEALIARMFSLVGPRWSLIAGRIPGRTAQEIEKYWTSKRTSYVNHNNPE